MSSAAAAKRSAQHSRLSGFFPRIARARRLAIIMHAVLRNKTEFAQA
jgi:hypothetical protein